MTEEFRIKLKRYYEGTLSEEEAAEVENELEKMEIYQSYLDEFLDKDQPQQGRGKNGDQHTNKQRKIIKKGKWRARVENALTAIVFLLVLTILSSSISGAFFVSGSPNRVDTFREVISRTIAVTRPNLRINNDYSQIGAFFTMDNSGTLEKRVGGEYIRAGEFDMRFLFNRPGAPDIQLHTERVAVRYPFQYPGADAPTEPEWSILENLPEGTVAEAYISLDGFYQLEQVTELFAAKEIAPVWAVVDTGFDDMREMDDNPWIPSPIGFPVGSGRSDVSEYFLETLTFLQRHEDIANSVGFRNNLFLQDRLDYLNDNGIKIYGLVVTGPTKEILQLREESWVTFLLLGEVRLWNWR
ncbi:hypothetical protein DealDRAFT_0516 [Dethiobacter alkaliphilus AHT 1]|uniref:Anti-sigma factor n=2 Tax=Dethiobacter TaxID=427925 RepID=C0GD65_DETAL|nr:hypothetical protein DealDRAFT_0516 [Dethiobacter alkaliphilus AHT 1]